MQLSCRAEACTRSNPPQPLSALSAPLKCLYTVHDQTTIIYQIDAQHEGASATCGRRRGGEGRYHGFLLLQPQRHHLAALLLQFAFDAAGFHVGNDDHRLLGWVQVPAESTPSHQHDNVTCPILA